jgi:alpha-beta hydrolase superfamily lysophospholipase
MSPRFLVLALSLVVLPLHAADRPVARVTHGSMLSATLLGVVSPAEIERQAAGFFETYPVPRMSYPAESWLLTLASEDFDGTPVVVKAQLFVPRIPGAPRRPLLVFGSGTTGLADACAPSLEQPEVRRLGWYTADMLSYAGLGTIVIFPDYIGFNDPARPQRYFSSQAEAHVMLDAARAALSFMDGPDRPVRASAHVFAAGYSQGGHAAFAAADARAAYAPELPLAGIIGFGATTDVTALLREGPVYAPFILYSWSQMYGTAEVDPSLVLQDRWASTLAADAARMCVDEYQVYYPADSTRLYRTDFHQALNNDRVASVLPRLAARLAENRTGLSGHRLPALIVQGNADIVVTTATQDLFVKALRAAGSAVRYLAFDGVRHRSTRPAGFMASLEWMQAIDRGEAAPSGGRGS